MTAWMTGLGDPKHQQRYWKEREQRPPRGAPPSAAEANLLTSRIIYLFQGSASKVTYKCILSHLLSSGAEFHGVASAPKSLSCMLHSSPTSSTQHPPTPTPTRLDLGREASEAVISQHTAVQGWRQPLIREPAVIHSPGFSAE